ncbi:MAG TPA: hypothetical protein VKS60_03555, partial [Stellaceae bacterium]|nr:hypothetical protein [Stellaceae bacterium]
MWLLDAAADGDPEKLYDFHRNRSLRTGSGQEIKGLIAIGSVLSVIEPSEATQHHEKVREVLDWCRRITSLELLSPVAMRSKDRGTPGGIGTRGQRLSGFLAALDAKTRGRIVERLADFYPLQTLSTTRKRAGWVDLRIAEQYNIGA